MKEIYIRGPHHMYIPVITTTLTWHSYNKWIGICVPMGVQDLTTYMYINPSPKPKFLTNSWVDPICIMIIHTFILTATWEYVGHESISGSAVHLYTTV
jgi:hypothetical protein